MPEQDSGTRELEHAEEVSDVVLPASDEPPRVLEPRKEALDFPATPRPPQGAAVLGCDVAAAAMPGDHLDAVVLAEPRIERIAVIPAIADQARREGADETRVERGGDEVAFIR